MNPTTLKSILLGLAGAALLLASCQKSMVPPETDNAPKVRALSVQETKTIGSSNDFAFRAFGRLGQDERDKNIFISPFSISAALTMAYNGAGSTTKEAMKHTLGFSPLTEEEINQSYKSLAELLTGVDKKVTFTSANSIWHAQQYQLQAPFVQTNKTYFDATVQGLDFSSAGAKSTINNWVKDKTKGKIEDIIQEIRPEHVMFLVNAIYFKGTWTYPFDKQLTQKSTFRKEDGSTANVDFMTMKGGKYLYHSDARRQLIDLPYGNRQYSMTLLVPNGPHTVGDLTRDLSSEQLSSWLASADTSRLDLRLPKFKLEYQKELSETLQQLGMAEAFSSQADFSRMLAGSNQGLAISEVLHKTFVEVNEEGTEAAAATSVGIELTSMPPSVRVDRPFIFLIREKSSNAILFIGQLMNPS
jgi:serine protease inhibitor